jgi:hypothetical protein
MMKPKLRGRVTHSQVQPSRHAAQKAAYGLALAMDNPTFMGEGAHK